MLALASAVPAWAALGDDLASIRADQRRLAASRSQGMVAGVQVHTLTTTDGSTVRQYLSPGGRVFAVTWNTRFKPRLNSLLGTHFPAYAEAGRAAQRQRPGARHAAVLGQGDLVVESMAHLNAHVGRAYLKSLLPAATALDAIR
jgi:hypothetical protein